MEQSTLQGVTFQENAARRWNEEDYQ